MSMMIVALIMRPWIGIIRALGGNVSCYILADDVLVITKGKDMASKLADAINSTHLYLQRMRARVAPDKSYNFRPARRCTGGSKKHGGGTSMHIST